MDRRVGGGQVLAVDRMGGTLTKLTSKKAKTNKQKGFEHLGN
jgi:hypothetical protein